MVLAQAIFWRLSSLPTEMVLAKRTMMNFESSNREVRAVMSRALARYPAHCRHYSKYTSTIYYLDDDDS